MSSSAPDLTIGYYNSHAQAFSAETIAVDLQPLYERFLPWMPDGAHILDAGCGCGRDARVFANLGYRVTAFDACEALASHASILLGKPVAVQRFQDLDWEYQFDGIWACASLLHVPGAELPGVFQRLLRALKPDGVIYASFKYGSQERWHRGRFFCDLNEQGVADLQATIPSMTLLDIWVTADRRVGREDEQWLNLLVRGSEAASR